jgi:hypothetical protein
MSDAAGRSTERWMASMTQLRIALAAVALGGAASACADSVDREVMVTVLENFGARADAHFYDLSAKLAIAPTTQQLRDGETWYQYINQGEGHCSIPKPLYLDLVTRNAKPAAASELLPKSTKWFLVTPSEMDKINPAFPPPPGVARTPVKTLVTLTKPAYSSNGLTALVFLDFVWSIHGANARYVLRRESDRWVVACSQLLFAV